MKISLHHQVAEREKEETLSQYKGTGYVSTRGFINLIFDETTPSPSKFYPKEIDSHILGVMLAVKKDTELFGEVPMRLEAPSNPK